MKSQITIKKIQDLLIKGLKTIYVDDDTSRRMWWASLEVIQKDFLSQNYKQGGIWVASPLPAFNDKKFLNQLHGWLWSPEGFPYFQNENAGFLPVNNSEKIKKDFDLVSNYKVLNLSQEDGYPKRAPPSRYPRPTRRSGTPQPAPASRAPPPPEDQNSPPPPPPRAGPPRGVRG